MPVLLPAIGFIITVLIVTSYGLTPMGAYIGVNGESGYRNSGYETDIRILDNELYTETLDVYVAAWIDSDESVSVNVSIYQDETLVDTIPLYVEYSSATIPVTDEEIIALPPGNYQIQLNFTYDYQGIGDIPDLGISFAISQPLVAGMTQEIVDWSTYQFLLNIMAVGILLAGVCIGSSTKRVQKVEETDWKTTTEISY
jgi:hypothetical protein